jgi:hypothetical protein
LDQSLIKLGFNRCVTEHAIYIRCDAGGRLIVRVYVDDLIITGANTDMVGKFKAKMQSVFKMSDLGPLSYYLELKFIIYYLGSFSRALRAVARAARRAGSSWPRLRRAG